MENNKKDIPDNGDDSNWIGFIYFNRNDKRLFPPNRMGEGWTINFANPYSVVCLIAILLIINVVDTYIARHK